MAGFVYLRASAKRAAYLREHPVTIVQNPNCPISKCHRPDFTEFLDEPVEASSFSVRRVVPVRGTAYQPVIPYRSVYPVTDYATISQQPPAAYAADRRSVSAVQTSENYTAAQQPRAVSSAAGTTVTRTAPARRTYMTDASYQTSNATSPAASSADLLAAYTPRQVRQVQQKLNNQLNNLSDAIKRAILKTTTPKTKQEEMIDKYLAYRDADKAGNTTSAASPAEAVQQQIASQSNHIISDIRKNYGDEAAGRASQLMSDFEQEMADTLNKPGDALEKQIAAQKVNNKYNEKLQKLNKEESLKKIREQLSAENEAYLKKVSEVYGTNTANALRPVMEDYADKRLTIWTTPQREEEALAAEQALEKTIHEQQEKILREKAGVSGGDRVLLENQLLEDKLKGEKDLRPFSQTATEQASRKAEWQTEKTESLLPSFQTEEVKAEAGKMYDDLITAREDLASKAMEQSWTNSDYQEAYAQLSKDYNERLKKLYEKDYNALYEQYYKDLPAEQKNKARSVWQQYNAKRVELAAQLMSGEERKRQLETLSQEEQDALQAVLAGE